MEEQKYFRIGEVSRLFGIGVDSIRYYEEMGILSPFRNPDNNYRLYTIEDIRKITMIRELLNLNFSLEQIREFDHKRNVANSIKMLEKELDIVNEAIIHLYETKSSILSRLTSFEKNLIDTDYGIIKVKELKKRQCILISEKDLPDEYVDYYLVKYMHNMHQKIDTIGACDCYTLDLENTESTDPSYATKNVFFYSETLNYESNYTLEGGTYLSLRYRGNLSNTRKYVPELYRYAEEHQLTPLESPIEMCHIDDYETSDENEYVIELQLRVGPSHDKHHKEA